MKRVSLLVAVSLLAIAFASFVWPTQWRYETTSVRNNRFAPEMGTRPALVRVNRFTGMAEYLDDRFGWIPMASN